MNEEKHSKGIKAWAEDDRPREKFVEKGRHVLTDAELVALLIGSGSRSETAVELSRRILSSKDNNLNEVGKMSVKDLMTFKGIGEAKAITIAAAMELGRRRRESEIIRRDKITSSKDVFELMKPVMADLPHEEFRLILLNRANAVLRKEMISRGGIAGTVVDTRIIFKSAVMQYASSIIICHNHPSGNLKPSEADIRITRSVRDAGKIMEITLFDHIIVTDAGYYSFADEGLI